MQARTTIRQTLVTLMETETGNTFADLDDAQNLRTDLGLDSVDVVSIVSQVERRFRIRMTQESLARLVTLGDVLDLLEAKLKEAEAAAKAA